jgi:hypothetical protein
MEGHDHPSGWRPGHCASSQTADGTPLCRDRRLPGLGERNNLFREPRPQRVACRRD